MFSLYILLLHSCGDVIIINPKDKENIALQHKTRWCRCSCITNEAKVLRIYKWGREWKADNVSQHSYHNIMYAKEYRNVIFDMRNRTNNATSIKQGLHYVNYVKYWHSLKHLMRALLELVVHLLNWWYKCTMYSFSFVETDSLTE